jgi:hypothetical protein
MTPPPTPFPDLSFFGGQPARAYGDLSFPGSWSGKVAASGGLFFSGGRRVAADGDLSDPEPDPSLFYGPSGETVVLAI